MRREMQLQGQRKRMATFRWQARSGNFSSGTFTRKLRQRSRTLAMPANYWGMRRRLSLSRYIGAWAKRSPLRNDGWFRKQGSKVAETTLSATQMKNPVDPGSTGFSIVEAEVGIEPAYTDLQSAA